MRPRLNSDSLRRVSEKSSRQRQHLHALPFRYNFLVNPLAIGHTFAMSAEDEQSQLGFEDGGAGPGAPTPLSALEVRAVCRHYTLLLMLPT